MSTNQDIGGLKADMETVKKQTASIFTTINTMNQTLTAHMATHTAKTDEHARDLAELKSDHKDTKGRVRALEDNQRSAKWWVFGLGGGGFIGAGALVEMIKTFLHMGGK